MIDKKTLDILSVAKEEQQTEEVKEAVKAIETVGQIMDIITSNKQIDLAFLRLIMGKSIRNIKKTKSNN